MFKKRVDWWSGTRELLGSFPEKVRYTLGTDLRAAQYGRTGANSKPLHGFPGTSVMEIVCNETNGAFRVVYTAKAKDAVIVLHVFQKKSVKGVATPKAVMETIRQRFKSAQQECGF